jgi:hypothetical protein
LPLSLKWVTSSFVTYNVIVCLCVIMLGKTRGVYRANINEKFQLCVYSGSSYS